MIEGPYYKTNSPETTNLVQDGMAGTVITITGQVLDQAGNPVPNALLDFWQANANGQYDNAGYTLRGHEYTDANGYYTLSPKYAPAHSHGDSTIPSRDTRVASISFLIVVSS